MKNAKKKPRKKTARKSKINTKTTSSVKAQGSSKTKGTAKKSAVSRKKTEALGESPNPTGKCTWVNSAGQAQCRDGITKAACAKFPNSVFTPGGSCL